jgi:RHS repeat-associated protein
MNVKPRYYYAGSTLVAMRKGSSTLNYMLGDHLGSTAITTNSSGGKVAEIRYYPWGTERYTYGTTPTTYHFTEQRLESGIGLYYYGARWYDPAVGRFIQADNLIPDQGNSQSWDRYSYTLNNPLKYSDPSGYHYCDSTNANPEECPNVTPSDYKCKNDKDCYDAYLTYKQIAYKLMRLPTESEIITMTIGSEYWSYVDHPYKGASTPRLVGREAVARQYYTICGTDGCSQSEMYRFMSGYQQWMGAPGKIDGSPSERAHYMLGLLNNDFSGTNKYLLYDVGLILNHDKDSYAMYYGWTDGWQEDKPWQFYSEPMHAGISLGFGNTDYAILAVNKGDGNFLFMFTRYQNDRR